MRVIDIGCGTGHIIGELAAVNRDSLFVGLDISRAMLEIAAANSVSLPNVVLIEGDGMGIPLQDRTFDIVMTRLAEYAPGEVYRILKPGGHLFAYGLGPEANKEIREFFPDRIELENFFFAQNMKTWRHDVSREVKNVGFIVSHVDDYKEKHYYENREEVMDLIEMVPLVKDFSRDKDGATVSKLTTKCKDSFGIPITWHYYILQARRP